MDVHVLWNRSSPILGRPNYSKLGGRQDPIAVRVGVAATGVADRSSGVRAHGHNEQDDFDDPEVIVRNYGRCQLQ